MVEYISLGVDAVHRVENVLDLDVDLHADLFAEFAQIALDDVEFRGVVARLDRHDHREEVLQYGLRQIFDVDVHIVQRARYARDDAFFVLSEHGNDRFHIHLFGWLVLQDHFARDPIFFDAPVFVAVLADRAVVAQHEVFVLAYGDAAARQRGAHVGVGEGEVVGGITAFWREVVKFFAVDEVGALRTVEADHVAGHPDHAFDRRFAAARTFEDYDIAALYPRADFEDDDLAAVVQRRIHRVARHCHRRRDEQQHDDQHDQQRYDHAQRDVERARKL